MAAVLRIVAIGPPRFFEVKLGNVYRLGLVVALYAFGVGVLKVPHVFGGCAFFKKQDIGLDAGVGVEHAIGEAHDGMKVAPLHEFFFDAGLYAFAKEGAIGQDHGTASLLFQQTDDEGEEEIGRFFGSELAWKIGFGTVFFDASKGRIGKDHVHLVVGAPVGVRFAQEIVAAHGRHVKSVEHEIGGAEQVGQGFFLNAAYGGLQVALVFLGFYLGAFVVDGAGQESSCTTGRVEHRFFQLRVGDIYHKLRNGTRRVILAAAARALQFFEDGLVKVVKQVAVGRAVEVDAVYLVDDLPEKGSVLHVIVGIFEYRPYDFGLRADADIEILEGRKEVVVDKVHQRIAGEAFFISRPRLPLQVGGYWAFVIVDGYFPFFFLIGKNL